MITNMHAVEMNIHLIYNFAYKNNLNNETVLCSSSNMNYVKYATNGSHPNKP